MSNEWSGVINTTAIKYLKGAQDHTLRDRLMLAMLKKRGRIMFNESGYELRWQVEFAQPNVESYGDGGTLTFARLDKYRQLVVDWRGYAATDQMTAKEREMNKSQQQLIDRYASVMPGLEKSITHKFGLEVYIDGYAAGNENRLCGLESFMGSSTTAAADKLAKPSDTYAGKSTAVGDQGGSWTAALSVPPNASIATDWPDGNATGGSGSEYDYLTPKLMNYSSTSWGTSSTSWEDNCERVIRQAVIWSTLTGGKGGGPELFLFDGQLYYGYLNKQSAKQRIIIPHKESEDLGFSEAVNQEGVAITREYGIAANTGYGINFNEMSLRSLSKQLFMPDGPEYDIRTKSWLFAIGFFGNMTFNPKGFSKIKSYA